MALLLTDSDLSLLINQPAGIGGLIDAVGGAFRENSAQARETNRHAVPLPTARHTLLIVSLVPPPMRNRR